MKCVHCDSDMEAKKVKGVEIDICTKCDGIWLDSGELKELTKYDLTAGRILSCLKCEKPMQTKIVHGVEIDVCPNCASIWLDSGELKKIAGVDFAIGRVLECPLCEKDLQTKMVSGVEVDICPNCAGVYLDKGEMEKLSAVKEEDGEQSAVGEFMDDALKIRVEVAIECFKEGKIKKNRAAEIAGVTIIVFEDLLKNYE